MTKVVIRAGSCGFTTTVTAKKAEGRMVSITLESDCEMVRKMVPDIEQVERMMVFTGFLENPVYRSAARCLKHVSCPVPAGILKAIETAAGMNVPKDASITFVVDGKP